ncbi:MAG: hypothetical protein JW932_13940 [Deltaproteobacteria bacterium]|nr:hypothetical protein [Deltaproteobacteria bacterium]
MNHKTNPLAIVFEKHLMTKGLTLNHMASFLRDLDRALMVYNDPLHLNTRMHLLGWNDLDVDYRTMELAEAYFDSDKMMRASH